MTLRDVSTGPAWLIWVSAALFGIISIVLLSGHGAHLIAGYNTSTDKEKSQYDTSKLCRVTGSAMAVITILILVMGIWEDELPSSFAKMSLVIVILDCLITLILCNTYCKKH